MKNYLLMTPLQKLAVWWWGLEEREREAIRNQFMERVRTDPVFYMQVRRLLEKQRAERMKIKNDGEQIPSKTD